MSPLLQTLKLCCERDDRQLISDLDLEVAAGHIYQIEGPNGSGKTTLLRVLCGLSSRYSGELLWCGKPLAAQRDECYQQMLYLGHSSGIKTVLTARENLRWHSQLRGLRDAETAIAQALAKAGLLGFEDSPCYQLSAGQQRRVGLARLFLGEYRLWILDEPFTAIDRQGVAELEGWIAEFASAGGAVLLTTHHRLAIAHQLKRIRLGVWQ